MLRLAIRNLLNSDATLRGVLAGGLYPTSETQPSILTPEAYPAAFDAAGALLPTLLVQDGSMIKVGPHRASAQAFPRVLVWQQDGRDQIDAALRAVFNTLQYATVAVSGLDVYRLDWAGNSDPLTDPAFGDAEHGWSRWTATLLIK